MVAPLPKIKWGQFLLRLRADVDWLAEAVRRLVRNQEIAIVELRALKQQVDGHGHEPPPGGPVVPLRAARNQQRHPPKAVRLAVAAVITGLLLVGIPEVGPGERLPSADATPRVPPAKTSSQPPKRDRPRPSASQNGAGGDAIISVARAVHRNAAPTTSTAPPTTSGSGAASSTLLDPPSSLELPTTTVCVRVVGLPGLLKPCHDD